MGLCVNTVAWVWSVPEGPGTHGLVSSLCTMGDGRNKSWGLVEVLGPPEHALPGGCETLLSSTSHLGNLLCHTRRHFVLPGPRRIGPTGHGPEPPKPRAKVKKPCLSQVVSLRHSHRDGRPTGRIPRLAQSEPPARCLQE